MIVFNSLTISCEIKMHKTMSSITEIALKILKANGKFSKKTTNEERKKTVISRSTF